MSTRSGRLQRLLSGCCAPPSPCGRSGGSGLRDHGVGRRPAQVFRLDVELAVLALLETVRARHDEGAQRMGALDVGIVINLDAPRRLFQPEGVGTPSSNWVWALFSARRRPNCSRALVRARSMISRFSPRWGMEISTRYSARSDRASASNRGWAVPRWSGSGAARCVHRRFARQSSPAPRPAAGPARGVGNRAGCPSSARHGRKKTWMQVWPPSLCRANRSASTIGRGFTPCEDWIWLMALSRSRSLAAASKSIASEAFDISAFRSPCTPGSCRSGSFPLPPPVHDSRPGQSGSRKARCSA